MQIDIISDIVCPWCYIGKRNLEKALSLYEPASQTKQNEELPPAVSWHPFQLNPDMPVEGMPRQQYLSSKFGGAERASEIYARVASAGAEAGIDFRFDKIATQPNTIDAHQLVRLAAEFDAQDSVVESLFRGYFLDNLDLTQTQVLIELAERGGLPREDAVTCLNENRFRNEIAQDDAHARSLGVQGVPFFVFNQKLAVSGAQPPDILVRAMTQTESQEPVATNA